MGATGTLIIYSSTNTVLATVSGSPQTVDGILSMVYKFVPADTSGLLVGTYKYKARITTSTNDVYTIAVGSVALL